MGCDIHSYVEKKEGSEWVAVRNINPRIAEYEKWVKQAEVRGNFEQAKINKEAILKMKKEELTVFEGWLLNDRNYALFAILADVRNNYGIIPIDNPKGLPANLSKKVLECSTEWEGDGHSYSYFTFEELLNYDWVNNFIVQEGFVDEKNYVCFKENGKPQSWCGDISGGGIEKILNYTMDRVVKRKYSWEEDKKFYTAVKWTEKCENIAEYFLNSLDTYILENYIANLADHRIVFWFDS